MSVSSNDDRGGPAGNKCGDVSADDGLSEHSAVKDISNGAIGRLPHFLELKFLNSVLIRSDSGALDSNLML